MNYVDSSEEESDSNVLETCWRWRLPRFTPPAAAAIRFTRPNSQNQLLIAQSDGSTESLENGYPSTTPTTANSHNATTCNLNDKNEKENLNISNDNSNITTCCGNNPKYELRIRPRSAGDISSDSFYNSRFIIDNSIQQSSPPQRSDNSIIQTTGNVEGVNPSSGRGSSPGDSALNATSSSTSNSTGGGFLSFFGVRFNKSGTRHLERNTTSGQSSSAESSEKSSSNRNSINESRYTKFPLSSSNSNRQTSTNTSFNNNSSPSQNPVLPRSNQTVTDSDPSTSSINVTETKPKQPQLKGKSKSDNNLHHRINLNNNSASVSNSSAGVLTVGNTDCKKKLNSVQLGDHATIRLPWTPTQQQNNLSSITSSNRSIPNTHTNIDFNKSSSRYIDTDFWNNQTHHHLPLQVSNTSQSQHLSRRQLHSNNSSQRRSRSLERASNFRVVQGNPNLTFSHPASFLLRQDIERTSHNTHQGSNSLERHCHSRIRQTPNPREEILLRNIKKSNSTNSSLVRNPSSSSSTSEKQKSHHHHHHIVLSSSKSNEFKLNENHLNKFSNESNRRTKPPLLGKLQSSSEPNSSFSSCDSSSSAFDCGARNKQFASSSAPPSPPPRPLCTLKPNKSRPVTSSFSFSSADKPPPVDRALKRRVPPFLARSASAMNSTTSNFNTSHNRRAVATPVSRSQSSIDTPTALDSTNGVGSTNSVHSHHLESAGATSNPLGPSSMSSVEGARNSGFINKPSKGWLHSDQLLTKEGVQYTVRYVGCLDVNTSMKSLDFDTRSLIAKECINQICEAAGLKSIDRKRRTDRRLVRLLGLRPRLEHAGSDVHLTITSTCLKLTSLDTGAIIAVHEMPNISFASGGDSTMLDFVAYVAKDAIVGRACFVLECGSGLAQDVITTVGQAFELRFKEYLQKRPQPPISRLPVDDPEYYNDMPGKTPPDPSTRTQDLNETKIDKNLNKNRDPPKLTLPDSTGFSVNLIDFEAPTPPAFGPTIHDKSLASLLLDGNSTSVSNTHETRGPTTQNDPFDMQPFQPSLNSDEGPLSPEEQKLQLESASWFHGLISRSEAELLVVNDGDFLVRESQTTPGQYVLTGIQNGSPKHLLLVDPDGVVRTKDRTFDSVSHLIHHHCDNNCPIISAESMVLLIYPIICNRPIPTTSSVDHTK